MPATAAALTLKPTNIWVRRIALILFGNLLLWASAKAQVPFWPVPMTMQTYVVLTLAVLAGWRLGAATLIAYLAEGAMGFPVFAGTPATGIGLAYMTGAAGGYLAGYLAAVVVIGLLVERGWTRTKLGTATVLLAGELTILGLGWAWLALGLGVQKAAAVGVLPFLAGDALKLVLAIGTVSYARRLLARR
jgi:biotin transport system substrate-specific component